MMLYSSSNTTFDSDTTTDPDARQHKRKSTLHFTERTMAVWFT